VKVSPNPRRDRERRSQTTRLSVQTSWDPSLETTRRRVQTHPDREERSEITRRREPRGVGAASTIVVSHTPFTLITLIFIVSNKYTVSHFSVVPVFSSFSLSRVRRSARRERGEHPVFSHWTLWTLHTRNPWCFWQLGTQFLLMQ